MEKQQNLQEFLEGMRLKDYRKFITDVQQYCGVTRATLSF